MDGKNFSKLCKDCSLIDKKFSLTDADLTFSKVEKDLIISWSELPGTGFACCGDRLKVLILILQVKTKGARKITFPEFKKAVAAIANKKVR